MKIKMKKNDDKLYHPPFQFDFQIIKLIQLFTKVYIMDQNLFN